MEVLVQEIEIAQALSFVFIFVIIIVLQAVVISNVSQEMFLYMSTMNFSYPYQQNSVVYLIKEIVAVGEFHSEALQVPHGCRFGHINDRQSCNDYIHWREAAYKQCKTKVFIVFCFRRGFVTISCIF